MFNKLVVPEDVAIVVRRSCHHPLNGLESALKSWEVAKNPRYPP